MPTVKYMSRSIKYVPTESGKRERIEHFTQATAKVKNVEDLKAIEAKKSFVRWRVGNLTIQEVIRRRKEEGRSDWYV